MLGKLVPCGGGPPIALGKATMVVGRAAQCDVVIACYTVSSRHCELQFRDGAWWVRDLGSKNGTSVNGVKRETQRLSPNDTLSIGRQRFTVAYQSATLPKPAPTASDDVEALALQYLFEDEPAAEAPRPVSQAAGPAVVIRADAKPSGQQSPNVASVIAAHGLHLPKAPARERVNLGKLVPCGGGDTIPLIRPQLLVGRSSGCDICLPHKSVSSRHCKLCLVDGYWFVEDLKSSNGTWVNGVRCQWKCLVPDSVLGLAKHRYTVQYSATGAGPPPADEDIFAQSLLEKAGLAKLMKHGGFPDTEKDEKHDDGRVRYTFDRDGREKERLVIKVLVVDDALADRALVSGLISKRLECIILEAEDGRQALALIKAEHPDIVLTDLHMPEMNGLELVRAVKEDCPDVPVVLMTALGSEEIAAQALQAGAASYVPKRRLADDLVRTVERVLETARDERRRSLLMHYVTASDMTFVLHNDPELAPLLVRHLLNVLRCLPLGDETERLRVAIALEEALGNAYYHGSLQVAVDGGPRDRGRYEELARVRSAEAPYSERRIHVRAKITRDQAVFVIRDEGPGFDVARLAPTAGGQPVDQGYGRGIRLMRSIMDEVTYNAAGNEVTLVKRGVKSETEADA